MRIERSRLKITYPFLVLMFICSSLNAAANYNLESPPDTLDAVNPLLTMKTQQVTDTIISGSSLAIEWEATDSSFSKEPISIGYFYQSHSSNVISIDTVANIGFYNWFIPETLNGVIILRIEAFDKYGNKTICFSEPQVLIGKYYGPCWYVSAASGNDSLNGSKFFPFKTIQKAIEVASSGDTIFVEPGTYHRSFDDYGKEMYISSTSSIYETHMLLQDPILLRGNTTITGFSFTGTTESDTAAYIVDGSPKIYYNRFSKFSISIICSGNSKPIIKNNLMDSSGVHIQCEELSEVYIYNNTIADGGTGIEVNSNDVKIHLINNIITRNTTNGGIYINADSIKYEIRYNNVWANKPVNYKNLLDRTGVDGNISDDPLFISNGELIYYLSSSSSSINAGDPSFDYYSEPEPNGDRINLGFYGGTSLAAVGELKFTSDINTVAYEDSIYLQTSGVLPDSNVNFSYIALNKPEWLVLDPDTTYFLHGTPLNHHVGIYPIEIVVLDNYDRSDTLVYTLEVVNSVPAFISEPVTVTNEDQEYIYDAQTDDEGQGEHTKYTIVSPSWVDIDSIYGIVSGIPTNDLVGEHQVIIEFDDGNGGIVEQRFQLTVLNVNDPPTMISKPDTSFLEDEELVVDRDYWRNFFYDIDNDISELEIHIEKDSGVVLHEFRSSENQDRFWASDNINGTGYFTMRVTDPDSGEVNVPFRINIIPVNDPPVIYEIPDTAIDQGTILTLKMEDYGYDIDNGYKDLTWDFKSAISSILYNEDDDSLIMTPPADFIGRDTIYCCLKDPDGLFDTDTFMVKLKDITPPNFTIGVFQNPVASEHLDLYFFPDEEIGQVNFVKIGNEEVEVSLMSNIIPNPYYCHYKIGEIGNYKIIISAADTTGNIGEGEYDFSSSRILASVGGVIQSPDSIATMIFPPKIFEKNQYVLCLLANSEATKVGRDREIIIAKQAENQVCQSYTFISPITELKNKVKVTFRIDQEQFKGLIQHLGICEKFNGIWEYKTTFTNESRNLFWIYTDKVGEYKLGVDAPNSPIILPKDVVLYQNYPNPFNSRTTIDFYLPEFSSNIFESFAKITIYDLLGRKVVELCNKPLAPGKYTVTWDGKDSQGKLVASGVYIYSVKYGEYFKSKKMVIIK